ncbi:adenylate/guanylate cyclase domain-containing protein [Rhizobium leguminosarum bv. viciae]|uniref:adenylate/guanylate cyclase domain-containing protein n=1 Tax=Rhizobium leguminosarum TaxID=384 RepID=UPI00103FBB66|nr:adenylate/guanylate cyclase domain-containing protein [Rhizobium leguminosarum]TCA18544.1 adenylate/guanylate cyclase domain-containing protein [Rhizobium leguminosarum bv. viciae]
MSAVRKVKVPTSKHDAESASKMMAFLVTDIEGSTYRWEAFPEGMKSALAIHDRIIRSAVRHNSGHVFHTAGDAFHAEFATPSAAVQAALQAQRTLSAQDFTTTQGLKVRMAVHAGPVEVRGGDYFGPGINRAARLLLIAYGGQVLVSGTVADMLQARLPSGSTLFDLGRHRFRDLSQPENVYQLVASDLTTAFPPLRSLGITAHQLPHPLTLMVGRSVEMKEVRRRVEQYRLVTLIGPGGAGKTRLAVEVGYQTLDSYPDGVWFVELGPLDDPRLVAEEICSVIGLPVMGKSATESVVGFLREKRALLILDNCEHLIDAAAEVSQAISSDCETVSIVATSREALGVPGESIFNVPSLAVPRDDDLTVEEALNYAAVDLLVGRANAVADNFELSEENVADVINICRQVDGIPLAIELAAPRLRMMRPGLLAEKLRDRFKLLGSRSRTSDPRHRTLVALFDWSYNLLNSTEQILLRRLSVFAGGWTLESATAVVSGDPVEEGEVFDLITSLADKSLVAVDLHAPEARYRLLETTRQYVFAKLRESGERGRRRRLAEYMTGLLGDGTNRWPKMRSESWIARYEPELDNLRVSLEWSFGPDGSKDIALGLTSVSLRIWDELSLLPERERWFRAAIEHVDAETPRDVVARLWLGRTSNSAHGDRTAFEPALKASQLYSELGDGLGLGEALAKAGAALLTPQKIEEAQPYLDEAVACLKPFGHTKQLASCLRSRGVAMYFAGQFEEARVAISESTNIARVIGDRFGIAAAAIAKGEMEFASGHVDASIQTVRRLIDEGQCNRRQLTLCLNNLTSYYLATEAMIEAKLTAFQGLHKARALGWPAAVVRMVEFIAHIIALDGNYVTASRLLGFTEHFYASESASREITEQRPYDRLNHILHSSLDAHYLDELKAEGAGMSEKNIVDLCLQS